MHLDEGFSNLENISVVDSNSHEIGRIVDFYFDSEFRIAYFVILTTNKSRLIFPLQAITNKEITSIHLNIPLGELVHVAKSGDQLKDLVLYGPLKGKAVKSIDDQNIGRIHDVVFHIDNHISLVLGGSSIREFFSKFGLVSDHHYLIPNRFITEISETHVKVNEEEEVFKLIILGEHKIDPKYNIAQRVSSHKAEIEIYRINR